MKYTLMNSPIGTLLLAGHDAGLSRIEFASGGGLVSAPAGWLRDDAAFSDARSQLDEYFAGRRRNFRLALAPTGTPFQLAVLDALRRIPYGETASYRDIAERIGRPAAVRAVGRANGRNPLPIVIPCHRVIGSNGQLTGFAGGLDIKAALLRLERRHGPAEDRIAALR